MFNWWKKTPYPGDAVDQQIRTAANSIAGTGAVRAVAIIAIDQDGLAHGNIAMTGVGFVGTKADDLKRQLAERLGEYQDNLL